MKRFNFWPEGSEIIENQDQVAKILSHKERTVRISEIQTRLREQSKTLSVNEKKSLLAKLFDLMEEDEVVREGEFDIRGHLHIQSQDEKYSAESVTTKAVNDSEIGEDGRKLMA